MKYTVPGNSEIRLNSTGDPREFAEDVYFWVNDESRYVTGETLHVNDVMVMHGLSLISNESTNNE